MIVSETKIRYKRQQQKIFDRLAQEPPLFLRSIGKEREHRLGFNFYRHLQYVKTKKIFDLMCLKPNALVLDIGCNDGELLNALYLAYKIRGVGIDFSIEALKKAREYNFSRSRYYFGDADRLPFKDNFFDSIVCSSILEHLPDIEPCIREIGRVLKKGGKLLIYTNNSKYKYTWHWVAKKLFLRQYDYEQGAGDAHDPAYFIDSLHLRDLLEVNMVKTDKIIYYHSFFTMLYDDLGQRTIYRLVCLFYLIKSCLTRKMTSHEIKPDIILKVYNLWLKLLLPFFEFLDRPLSRRGYSNAFYILAQKEQ